MKSSAVQMLTTLPVANPAPVAKAVVRRGAQLMVVYQGCPKLEDVDALLLSGVRVGLALSPSELATVPNLDDYSYVFTGMGRKGRSSLTQAVNDLAHNGWTIDDEGEQNVVLAQPRAPRTPLRLVEMADAVA